jgi:hypothetical protein
VAGADSRDRFTYAIGGVRQGGRSVEVNLALRESPCWEVDVRIVEAWENAPTSQVDALPRFVVRDDVLALDTE